MPERKHTPGATSRTPRTRSSAVQRKSFRLLQRHLGTQKPTHPETAEPANSPKKERTRFESQISLEVPARSSIMVAPSQREMRDHNSSRNNLPASSGRPRPSSGIPVRHFKSKILMSSQPLREKLRIRADATAEGGSRGPVARRRCRAPARQLA